jgi:hypothetical protein
VAEAKMDMVADGRDGDRRGKLDMGTGIFAKRRDRSTTAHAPLKPEIFLSWKGPCFTRWIVLLPHHPWGLFLHLLWFETCSQAANFVKLRASDNLEGIYTYSRRDRRATFDGASFTIGQLQ